MVAKICGQRFVVRRDWNFAGIVSEKSGQISQKEKHNSCLIFRPDFPRSRRRPDGTLSFAVAVVTISATIALRDDEPTERVMVMKIYFFSLWTQPQNRTIL
jgi:hypothetical protein